MGVGHNLDGGPCCGLRPPSAEGLVWPAPLSHLPTLQRFWVQGDSLYPRRGLRPLHPPWRDEEGAVVPPSPPSDAFGNRGTRCTPGGGCAPCTLLGGEMGASFLSLERLDFLSNLPLSMGLGRGLMTAGAAVPPGPPSNVWGYRETRCTPGGGAAPCTPLGKRRRRRFPTWRVGMLPSPRGRDSTPFLTFPRVRGQGQRRPGGLGRGGWDRCEARSSAVTARS